jgi:glycopeptide antibiotics resistance protein
MLGEFGPSTTIAILIGSLLALVAFAPVVAVRYRRAGVLRASDVLLLLGVACYGVAIWSYTLIPLPESGLYHCVKPNYAPLAFIHDIIDDPAKSLLHNKALFQVVFNVVFFMPLGGFLRILLKKGVVVATAVGALVSVLVETTQLTGIWGLYPCAYRTFDVDDVILNTSGALIGSLLLMPVAAIIQGRLPVRATQVTVGRRAVGMVVDVLSVTLMNMFFSVAIRSVEIYSAAANHTKFDPSSTNSSVAIWAPVAVEALCVLLRGQTLGEITVSIRPESNSPKTLWQRPLKFILGIGGYLALTWLRFDGQETALMAFCIISALAPLLTKDRRGLTGLLTNTPMAIANPEPTSRSQPIPKH